MFKNIMVLIVILVSGNLLAQNLLSGPESVAYDHQNNRYLVSNYYNGRIIEVDSLGGQSIFRQGLGRCLGNHIHEGILWVSVRDYWQVSSGRAVLGLDLATGETVHTIEFYATTNVDGIAVDNDGFVYVVDTTGRIYVIDVAAGEFELLTNIGLGQSPQDIFFDAEYNRLIAVNYSGSGSFLSAVDLESGGTTLLLDPDFGDLDGVCMDQYGNIYVASWNDSGVVYRIDDSFAYDPEIISSGNNGPAGLDYDPFHNKLIIPNFNANSLSIIELDFPLVADFTVSQTSGCAPLEVQFHDNSVGTPLVWWWDFNNDGVSDAFSADPVWIYNSPGVYTVALKVHDGSNEDQEIKLDLIVVDETSAQENLLQPVLLGNYPNPFNPSTTISYQLPAGCENVDLIIYNIKGQIVHFSPLNPSVSGHSPSTPELLNSMTWNGTDDSGKEVAAGIYFYKLTNGTSSTSKKMLLLK